MKPELKRTGRVIARFSCGAASAVATKLAIEKYGDSVEIFYSNTNAEHDDNKRFIKDCEAWFGREIHVLKSKRFDSTWDVWKKRKYLVNHQGAPCTGEMKRIPGESIWRVGDVEVFGYTHGEEHRLKQLQENNTEKIIECPLIEHKITKAACFGILQHAGIELPTMYKLGFKNNNCIACVKARDAPNYWKRIRHYFPDEFAEMAKLEREFGFELNRLSVKGVRTPVYLDQLPPGLPRGKDEVKISCGLLCMSDEYPEFE